MDANYKIRILKELELSPLWKLKQQSDTKPTMEDNDPAINADLFFVLKINHIEGPLFLLSKNFLSGTEKFAQDLFLNIAKFISIAISMNVPQRDDLLRLTKNQLTDLYSKTAPNLILAFGLSNDFFKEYKRDDLMNNINLNITHTFDINYLLQNPIDKKLVWESILDLIKFY